MPTKIARMTISNNNPVGMIVASMLTEAQFQAINGPSWVLADGRNVAGSVYATTTGQTTIPDMRGMVLRGKNNGRSDGNQDPGGERALGNFQADGFGAHRHQNATPEYINSLLTSNTQAIPRESVQRVLTDRDDYRLAGTATEPTIGRSSLVGGNETRMKNMCINYFIKINT